jgi:siroheme synthase (precorrin-2 oxidase/ferrochelatase)
MSSKMDEMSTVEKTVGRNLQSQIEDEEKRRQWVMKLLTQHLPDSSVTDEQSILGGWLL